MQQIACNCFSIWAALSLSISVWLTSDEELLLLSRDSTKRCHWLQHFGLMNIFEHVWKPAIIACNNCNALHAINCTCNHGLSQTFSVGSTCLKFVVLFVDHFSGPDRAIALTCLCPCVCLDNNVRTNYGDLHNWHLGSDWRYLGPFRNSRSYLITRESSLEVAPTTFSNSFPRVTVNYA